MRRTLLLALLAGCDFLGVGGQQVDPDFDYVLGCDNPEDLTDLPGGYRLPIDVETGQDFELTLDLLNPAHSARVRIDTGFEVVRQLEVWLGERRVIPARRVDGGTAELELIALDGELLSGRVEMACSQATEDCEDLIDNDGDGLTDCAAPTCAQHPECLASQEALEVASLACGDSLSPSPPVLAAFDDQVILYATRLDRDVPPWAFWGGAEHAFDADEGTVRITADPGSLVCVGSLQDVGVRCTQHALVDDSGQLSLGINGSERVWLEPPGPSFDSLAIELDCG